VAAGLREKGGLLAVEALRNGGEFVFERYSPVDRRNAAGSGKMREPVAQRQGIRVVRAGKRQRTIRCSVTCIHLCLHQCLAACRTRRNKIWDEA
jgi:hypothetical protein